MIESKLKHLEFIQGVINRMAQNSFLLRAWAIGLISALFAVASTDINKGYISIAYFAVIIFAILDSFYLRQERLFRALYDHARKLNPEHIDFSMDTKPFEKMKGRTFGETFFSTTIILFYGFLVATMITVMFFIN